MLVLWDGDVSKRGEETGMLDRSASVAQTRGGAGRTGVCWLDKCSFRLRGCVSDWVDWVTG